MQVIHEYVIFFNKAYTSRLFAGVSKQESTIFKSKLKQKRTL